MEVVNEIVKKLKSGKSVFLTGAAGTGKSYTAERVIQKLREDGVNVLVTASTGTAALKVGGITLHKALRFGIANDVEQLKSLDNKSIEDSSKKFKGNIEFATLKYWQFIYERLQGFRVIVIDEVSMLSKQNINMIYYRLNNLKINIPILFVGDFLQLPPVSKNKDVQYAFEHSYWSKIHTVTLTDVKRTDDTYFTHILNQVRCGYKDDKIVHYIKNHFKKEIVGDHVTLVATRGEARSINDSKLDSLSGDRIVINGVWADGVMTPSSVEKGVFLQDCPVQNTLILKIGAYVMITRNIKTISGSVVNGTLGVVTKVIHNGSNVCGGNFDAKGIEVLVDCDGKNIKLGVEKFSSKTIINRGGMAVMEDAFSLTQLPITLAYALTIHKAQGASIPKLSVDCGRIFTEAQLYVALSRATNTQDLSIKNFKPHHIKSNKLAVEYYDNLASC